MGIFRDSANSLNRAGLILMLIPDPSLLGAGVLALLGPEFLRLLELLGLITLADMVGQLEANPTIYTLSKVGRNGLRTRNNLGLFFSFD